MKNAFSKFTYCYMVCRMYTHTHVQKVLNVERKWFSSIASLGHDCVSFT
jgi:hypothetical protein